MGSCQSSSSNNNTKNSNSSNNKNNNSSNNKPKNYNSSNNKNINKSLNSISNNYPPELYQSQFSNIINQIKTKTTSFTDESFNKELMHKELKDIVKDYLKNINKYLSPDDKEKINNIATENNLLKLVKFIKNNPNQNISNIYNDLIGDYVSTIISHLKNAAIPRTVIDDQQPLIKKSIEDSINNQSGGKNKRKYTKKRIPKKNKCVAKKK